MEINSFLHQNIKQLFTIPNAG